MSSWKGECSRVFTDWRGFRLEAGDTVSTLLESDVGALLVAPLTH
jgi:hypothetical protein